MRGVCLQHDVVEAVDGEVGVAAVVLQTVDFRESRSSAMVGELTITIGLDGVKVYPDTVVRALHHHLFVGGSFDRTFDFKTIPVAAGTHNPGDHHEYIKQFFHCS